MDLSSEPDIRLNIYTADPNSSAADGLKLLAIWAADTTEAETEPSTG